jgi:hypothetical protein
MKKIFVIGFLLFLCVIFIASCDRGKKPYEETEVLFSQSNYSAAKSKAEEIIKSSPKSKYAPMAKEMVEKINMANDAMKYFRIYIQAMGARNMERVMVAKAKYEAQIDVLYKLHGGREHLKLRLRAFLEEVEKALDNLASIIEEYEKITRSGDENKKIIVADKFNEALGDFMTNYGQPTEWLDKSCGNRRRQESEAASISDCKAKELKEKTVDQWM